MTHYILALHIDNLQKLIKQNHPLTYKEDKEWYIKGYKLVKHMIDKAKNTTEANLYGMQYYITGFNDFHMGLFFNKISLLGLPFYPGFNVYYNYETNNLEIIGTKKIITHIDKKPYIEYLKKYLLFNNGNITDKATWFEQSFGIFNDFKNPYLEAPKMITVDGKNIELKYYKMTYTDFQYFKKEMNKLWNLYCFYPKYKIKKIKNSIYISIDSFNNINFNNDLKRLLPADNIIVDLRNNNGGSISEVFNFFKIVYDMDIVFNFNPKESLINYQCKVCNSNNSKYPDKNTKFEYPKLKIIVNPFSRSACKIMVNIAKTYIKNIEIEGETDLREKLCGTIVEIKFKNYTLTIPTHCNELKLKI